MTMFVIGFAGAFIVILLILIILRATVWGSGTLYYDFRDPKVERYLFSVDNLDKIIKKKLLFVNVEEKRLEDREKRLEDREKSPSLNDYNKTGGSLWII